MGIYEDNRYKSESKKSAVKSVDILGLGTGPEVEKKLKYAEDVTSGIIFGKELVNSPANVLTPGSYELISCGCYPLVTLFFVRAFCIWFINQYDKSGFSLVLPFLWPILEEKFLFHSREISNY